MTQNNKLRELFVQLDLWRSRLIITDEETGAGYITVGDDKVFARWSNYIDGITILTHYLNIPPLSLLASEE